MHIQAEQWIIGEFSRLPSGCSVLELGSRDLNGSCREILEFFDIGPWFGIDIEDGPKVDLVADAAVYVHPDPVDCVICTEVFEHTPNWREILQRSFDNLRPGGTLLVTMAGPGRTPHSGRSQGSLASDEFYENVDPIDLIAQMKLGLWSDVVVEYHDWGLPHGGDVYLRAKKRTNPSD